MLRSIGKQFGESVMSVRKKKRKDLQQRKVLSLEWKREGVMDDESDESMELMEKVPLKELGESELERQVHGWRREAASWFQRRGEAYRKERSVIRPEDETDSCRRLIACQNNISFHIVLASVVECYS